MKDVIRASAEESVRAVKMLLEKDSVNFIDKTSSMLMDCYSQGGKLLIAGNGGSLCDAMHFAEELTGIYREKRKALPAIAFSDPGHISCVGNDLGYEEIFARWLEALGQPEDLFVALTTSGNSQNLVRAVQTAKTIGMKTVAFLGKEGGKLKGQADLEWIVSGFKYSDRIQEAHMAAIHIIIEVLERKLQRKSAISRQPVVCLKSFL